LERKGGLAHRKAKQVGKAVVGGVLGTAWGLVTLPLEALSRAETGYVNEPYLVERGLENLFGGITEALFDWDD